jgi:hypothetical protein
MNFKSKLFTIHMGDYCKDILHEALREMILELSANAIFVMNTDMQAEITLRTSDTIVDLLKHTTLRFMPFHLVCEGFQKGAMGELGGTTRFTVRNVNIWMLAMKDKCARLNIEKKSREDQELRAQEEKAFKQNQRISALYGAALYRKIEWCYSGLVSSEEYDRLSLDKIVEALQKGYKIDELIPEMIS